MKEKNAFKGKERSTFPSEVFGYAVNKRVGQGVGGNVFVGKHVKSGTPVAIKFAPLGDPMSLSEVNVYRTLKARSKGRDGVVGFPKMHWYGHTESFSVLVLDLLDTSLTTLLRRGAAGAAAPPGTVLEVGRQVVQRLAELHAHNYLHSDVKPDNVMLKDGRIYLVDFGLSRLYVSPVTNRHVDETDETSEFSGSPNFASVSAHAGRCLSRRDDLESLAYTLIFLAKGALPWSDVCGNGCTQMHLDRVMNMKRNYAAETLCEGLPASVTHLFQEARRLGFAEAPDYSDLASRFTKDLLALPDTHSVLIARPKL